MSDSEQKKIITELISAPKSNSAQVKNRDKKTLQDAIDTIKKTAKIERTNPGSIVKVLSKTDQLEFRQLAEQLAPATGKDKKAKEG